MKKKEYPRAVRIGVAAISITLSLFAFGTGLDSLAGIFALQLGPDMARVLTAFSLPILVIILTTLVLTFIFGRFYCAVICPLGILQDFIGFVSRKKGRKVSNYYKTRYTIAVIMFGMLFAGWAVKFRILEPYSNFGGIASAVFTPFYVWLHNLIFPDNMLIIRDITMLSLLTGLIPLALLIFFVSWRKRVFCTTVCPVGTLLGLCAKHGTFRMSLSEKCIKCGKCVSVCPSGCINPDKRELDNERCVRCMNCKAICPVDAVKYGLRQERDLKPESINSFRRNMIVGAGAVTAAAAFGVGLGALGNPQERVLDEDDANKIYPPGAGSAARFASKCTNCQLCVTNCKGNVLRAGDGFTGGAVHLKFDKGMCEHNCKNCSDVCPTGALKPMPLKQKQLTRIGLANFNPNICIAVQDRTDCGACAEHCPTGALRMKPDETGMRIPFFNPHLCIGCGSCEYPCPVRPVRAIIVEPVTVQVLAEDPEEYFKENMPVQDDQFSKDNDEWLI